MLHLLKTQAKLLSTCWEQWRGLAAELAAISTQLHLRCTDLYVWPAEWQANREANRTRLWQLASHPNLNWGIQNRNTFTFYMWSDEEPMFDLSPSLQDVM